VQAASASTCRAAGESDGRLAHINRSQAFTKERRGQTQVRETFSAVARGGAVSLSLAYEQGRMLLWGTADKPNLPLLAAHDPRVVALVP
jgi:hypothetical protein